MSRPLIPPRTIAANHRPIPGSMSASETKPRLKPPMTFSPHASRKSFEERFTGLDRRKVLEGQHGDDEVAGQRPDHTNDAHDDAADEAHALFERAQDDADGGGHQRPLKNGALARPGQLEAVAERPGAAHQ